MRHHGLPDGFHDFLSLVGGCITKERPGRDASACPQLLPYGLVAIRPDMGFAPTNRVFD